MQTETREKLISCGARESVRTSRILGNHRQFGTRLGTCWGEPCGVGGTTQAEVLLPMLSQEAPELELETKEQVKQSIQCHAQLITHVCLPRPAGKDSYFSLCAEGSVTGILPGGFSQEFNDLPIYPIPFIPVLKDLNQFPGKYKQKWTFPMYSAQTTQHATCKCIIW